MLLIDKIRPAFRKITPLHRRVLLLVILSAVAGIAAATAIAIFAPALKLPLIGIAALVCFFMAGAFVLSLLLRRTLSKNSLAYIGRPEVLIRRQGWRFVFWFTGHALFWLALALCISLFLTNFSGLTVPTLAVIAGLLAGASAGLMGLLLARRPLMLGICWKEINWSALDSRWRRFTTALVLRERHAAAVEQDLKQTPSQFRTMVAILDQNKTEEPITGMKADLWESGTIGANWATEFWRRARMLVWPALLTFLIALPIFFLSQPWINDKATQVALIYDQLSGEDAASEIASVSSEDETVVMETSSQTPDADQSPNQNVEQDTESQDGQPQDGEPQDGEPQDGEPQDGQSQDGQPQDGQPQDGQPQESQPQDGQPQDGQPQDGETQDGQPQDGQPQDGQPQEGQPQEGQPQEGEPQDGQPQDGETQDGQPQDSHPQEGQSQEGQPQDGQLPDGEASATGDGPAPSGRQTPSGATIAVTPPPPVPSSSENGVDIDLPPLAPPQSTAVGTPGTPEATVTGIAPTVNGTPVAPGETEPGEFRPIQLIPNWILALLGLG